MISAEQLKTIMPRADEARWADPLNKAMARFAISTAARSAMFLAQVAVESAELTRLEENLDYSAARLMEVWPRRFTTVETAARYAHRSDVLANYVYANRLGNGDSLSGDGWRYRGRGLIQLTGADAYRSFGRAVGDSGILLSPDRLLTEPLAALSAAWFFSSRGCNELADTGDIIAVSRRINGAEEGLERRKEYFHRATGVLH